MSKGTSIFYTYHEQGTPLVIAGIYSEVPHTEDEMRQELLSLVGSKAFNSRESINYFDHKKVLAQYWLDDNKILDKDTNYVLSKFFPEALSPESLQVSSFKFLFTDGKADEFIWRNRKHKEVNAFIRDLLYKSAITSENYKRNK